MSTLSSSSSSSSGVEGSAEIAQQQQQQLMVPFLAGGAGVALVSVGLGMARSSSRVVASALRRRLTTTLEVTSKDAAYPWVLKWLEKSSPASFRHLSSVTTAAAAGPQQHAGYPGELVPSPGRHVAYFKGWPLLVERAREYGTVATSSGTPWERVVLTTASAAGDSRELFGGLLAAARDAALAEAGSLETTTLYSSWGTEWRPFGHPRPKRPLESVVLRSGIRDLLVGDVAEWRDSAEWYRSRGVPYRRGYLLHGPPGGGKSSLVVALAGHFNLDVCVLTLSDESLTDDRLALSLANVPPDALVLLEDVDAAFGGRHTGRPETKTPLTLGGLLNALDGAIAAEGRLVFMTTNHADALDAALLRPGRVDVVHRIDWADKDQAAELFKHFYTDKGVQDDDDDDKARAFAADAVDAALRRAGRPPSMAELQAFLIARKRDSAAALRQAQQVADVALERRFVGATGDDLPPLGRGATTPDPDDREAAPGTRRPCRPLTPLQVDRMVFNPQPGWEDMVGKIVGPGQGGASSR